MYHNNSQEISQIRLTQLKHSENHALLNCNTFELPIQYRPIDYTNMASEINIYSFFSDILKRISDI